MEDKKIYFIDLIRPPYSCLPGYSETKKRLDMNMSRIYTAQMSLMSTELFERGYRVFVWDMSGRYEIVLGGDNTRTRRFIRPGHDLFKLWKGGEFLQEVSKNDT